MGKVGFNYLFSGFGETKIEESYACYFAACVSYLRIWLGNTRKPSQQQPGVGCIPGTWVGSNDGTLIYVPSTAVCTR